MYFLFILFYFLVFVQKVVQVLSIQTMQHRNKTKQKSLYNNVTDPSQALIIMLIKSYLNCILWMYFMCLCKVPTATFKKTNNEMLTKICRFSSTSLTLPFYQSAAIQCFFFSQLKQLNAFHLYLLRQWGKAIPNPSLWSTWVQSNLYYFFLKLTHKATSFEK